MFEYYGYAYYEYEWVEWDFSSLLLAKIADGEKQFRIIDCFLKKHSLLSDFEVG